MLASVNTISGKIEDKRYDADVCGVIETAAELSEKIEWAQNYIDTEINSKLEQIEQKISDQDAKLEKKIEEAQREIDKMKPPTVGTIKFSASQNVDNKWLKCDGRFVSENDYPELVKALGKLTPSGDKFKLISDGEIGPQISNGVVYGGRMWVYSYATKKLYGVDLDGNDPVKEITLTSSDPAFNNFTVPTNNSPIALSIVPSDASGGVKLFLAQIKSGKSTGMDHSVPGAQKSDFSDCFVIFEGAFTADVPSITLAYSIDFISRYGITMPGAPSLTQLFFDPGVVIPLVSSDLSGDMVKYYCAIGSAHAPSYGGQDYYVYIEWSSNSNNKVVEAKAISPSFLIAPNTRTAFSAKNKGEAICPYFTYVGSTASGKKAIYSVPYGTFDFYIVNVVNFCA